MVWYVYYYCVDIFKLKIKFPGIWTHTFNFENLILPVLADYRSKKSAISRLTGKSWSEPTNNAEKISVQYGTIQ